MNEHQSQNSGTECLDEAGLDWDSARLASAIAALGYPCFRQLSDGPTADPAIVLLAAVGTSDLEIRVIEALPWLSVSYYKLDWSWVIARAEERRTQNRLGFVVTLGRRIARKRRNADALQRLGQVEEGLKRVRLATEDTLCQASLSEVERRWLRESRTREARYWHLVTGVNSKQLPYDA